MAKTALELTAEELRLYHPDRKLTADRVAGQRQKAWEVARTVADILRRDFGAARVAVFGSLVDDGRFSLWSDVDLASWGIPAHRFFDAVAAVSAVSPDFRVELVDIENCRASIRKSIEREGIEL